ncbi:hypothetical protein EFY79_04165 [Hanamia caeni]|uniref:Glycosyltransferase RgtA/B/C/D-like domain-containing protein n=1 Tax=Hanamia caeni TaxID=2294116 RepID=A0A3M9NMG8_9BACT|nr:hypothetical protein [Hanamia caeni]RNI38864.1 hypothetical protein EFY79_04165 [Hanamia caeni]
MNFADFILLPVYIFILYLFFRSKRKKYADPLLQKYHRQGFWIKIIASILFILYYSYLTLGDTTVLFHCEGNNLYHLILKDPSNFKYIFKPGKEFDLSLVNNPFNKGYFRDESNYMIIRLDTIFSFFCFGSFAVISLFFAALAFSGLWKLYLFFYEQLPRLHKQFAISILYFPTLAFWSAGLLKDSLCIAALGWLTYGLYNLLYKKKSVFKNVLIIFISAYFLTIIKVYILLAYVPFFILFIILKNLQHIKFKLFRYLVAPLLIGLSMYAFTQTLTAYNDDLGAYAVEDLTSSISNLNRVIESRTGREDAASNFSLGSEFDGSFRGLIKIAPVAVSTTFFRPFIWEAHKISQLMAALESLLLMFFTLYILLKAGLLRFIKWIFKDPLLMYCFLFSVIFGLFVGASTLNFGTLVRYKIPCLPFFSISLFLIFEKVKERAAIKQSTKEKQSHAGLLQPSVA